MSSSLAITAFSIPVYFNHHAAIREAEATVTTRVMDSLHPFQDRFQATNKRYAVGTYDHAAGDHTITEQVGWEPSIQDSNRYVVHIIGSNIYKVVATTQDGTEYCRIYPAKRPCMDIETYLRRGH